MKKLLIFSMFFITWYSLLAQQTRFFVQSEVTVGSLQGDSRLQVNEFISYTSAQIEFESWDLKKEKANWSYGAGIKGGIVLKDFLHFYTGARYRKVVNETIFSCITCDYIVEESTLLQTDFLEIPLGIRFNILKNNRLQPYLSSEVFWAKALNRIDKNASRYPYSKSLNLFRIAYKAGAAYKIGKLRNWEISLQSGLNTNLGKQKSYPRYHFREVTAEVGVLRVF